MSKDTPADRAAAYTSSGVNINSAYELVRRIKDMAKTTRTPGLISEIGGFGGLFQPDFSGMHQPVLVASTDGVGTKLKLAFAYNHHSSIGIDLVAMSVNDIIVQGATPLFFLDYFATGKLNVDVAEQVVSGVAEGCRQSHCALLGGETAEMPGMYAEGEYDLAGFCVGLADKSKLVDGSSIRVGDMVIGLASSGAHSNGYSLIRKLLEKSGLKGSDQFPGLEKQTVRDVIMRPTFIYTQAVRSLMADFKLKGMAHITGGGFYENIPRALPGEVSAAIDFNSWPKRPLFEWIKNTGELSWPEMLQIFNCGIGYIIVTAPEYKNDILNRLSGMGQEAWAIGTIIRRETPKSEQVSINF
jgi:phosphoribosylformylglycinamidine cyclo-ligase